MTAETYFPFTAIVGQADMKDALLCNAVNPAIGGVLIAGTRGTAKSTAARSLAHLLPHIRIVADCPYNCSPDDPAAQCEGCADRDIDSPPERIERIRTPFVTLPIGATEDRVLGTIDIEAAIQEGERTFQPGLLARANRGTLYVDEVNLLGDHLVDILLDAVATGVNRVEREGISYEHPAEVLLVGTMNPEEGDLRPQLLDRFGLSVAVDRAFSHTERKTVVRRRTQFDADPVGMMQDWRENERRLARRIAEAREALSEVTVEENQLDLIAEVCLEHDVDGLRADIVIHRTARALAALAGAGTVTEAHVTRAAELALGHRANASSSSNEHGDDPTDDDPDPHPHERPPDRPAPETLPVQSEPPEAGRDNEPSDIGTNIEGNDADGNRAPDDGDDRVFPVAPARDPPRPEPNRRIDRDGTPGQARRQPLVSNRHRGVSHRARRPRGQPTDVSLPATLRAAASHHPARRADEASDLALRIEPADLREPRRMSPAQHLVVFVVDSSGSMAAYRRMAAVKGAVVSLLVRAYQQRDYVSLIAFRKNRATVLLSPTTSVQRAAAELASLPTGGRTPLAAGLERGLTLIERTRRTHRELIPVLVVVTDGRSNYAAADRSPWRAALDRADRIRHADVFAVCFDTESGPVRLSHARTLAERMGATYHRFDEFEAANLSAAVEELFDRRR